MEKCYFFQFVQTDTRTDGRTEVKQYAPDLSIRGHKKVKLLKMGNFTFFHYVFYAICILKSFNSHTSVVVCSFFEFGTVSKWCITEWDNGSWECIKVPRLPENG